MFGDLTPIVNHDEKIVLKNVVFNLLNTLFWGT